MVTRSIKTLAAVITSAIVLSGCGSTTPAATAPPADAPTKKAPAKIALPTGGRCVLLPLDRATSLLGSAPKASSSGITSAGKIVHIDGCTYTGTAGNLGYDINDHSGSGLDPKLIVQRGVAGAAKAPGAQTFDVPGGDAAVGFTLKLAAKTMARIEIAKGPYTVAVNALATDPAKAKQTALSAAALLLTAIG